jgi:hypothetical protein
VGAQNVGRGSSLPDGAFAKCMYEGLRDMLKGVGIHSVRRVRVGVGVGVIIACHMTICIVTFD